MIKSSERKASYSSAWLAFHPNALMEHVQSYLSAQWQAVNDSVRQKRIGINLYKGSQEHGIVVPPDFFYVYQAKFPRSRKFFPVYHVEESDFHRNPARYFAILEAQTTLVLLDQKRPFVALASTEFRNLVLDEDKANGNLQFIPRIQTWFFQTEIPAIQVRTYEQQAKMYYSRGIKVTAQMLRDAEEQYLHPIDAQNGHLLDEVLRELEPIARCDLKTYISAVSRLRIDIKRGKVYSELSQAADEPPHEPG